MFEIISIIRLTSSYSAIAGTVLGAMPMLFFFTFFLNSSGNKFEKLQNDIFRNLQTNKKAKRYKMVNYYICLYENTI